MDEQEMVSQQTETENAGNEVETASTDSEKVEEENKSTTEETTETKTFTQEQVNEIVKQRLLKQEKRFLTRFGVEKQEELDDFVKKSQDYDLLKEDFEKTKLENSQLLEQNAFLEQNIEPKRYDDIRVYFKGKGLNFTKEALCQELASHPEWVKELPKKTTIETLGVDSSSVKKETEDERMKRIFGS